MTLGWSIKVRENKVVDTLSRKEAGSSSLSAISFPTVNWLNNLRVSYHEDSTKEVLAKWEKGELDLMKYNFKNGILSYKGRLFVGANTNLREKVMQQAHDSPVGNIAHN